MERPITFTWNESNTSCPLQLMWTNNDIICIKVKTNGIIHDSNFSFSSTSQAGYILVYNESANVTAEYDELNLTMCRQNQQGYFPIFTAANMFKCDNVHYQQIICTPTGNYYECAILYSS